MTVKLASALPKEVARNAFASRGNGEWKNGKSDLVVVAFLRPRSAKQMRTTASSRMSSPSKLEDEAADTARSLLFEANEARTGILPLAPGSPGVVDVIPRSKEDQIYPVRAACGCGCGTTGAPRRKDYGDGIEHVRGCTCWRCTGSRSRRRGREKQAAARRQLGVPSSRYQSQNGHEENWRGSLRAEVKSGRGDTGPLSRAYLRAEAQSEATRPIGDLRPFVFVAMPPEWGNEGLIAFRLSRIHDVVEALGMLA